MLRSLIPPLAIDLGDEMLQVAEHLDTDPDGAPVTPSAEPGLYEIDVERLDPALHAWLARGTVAAGDA